ncbi:MAG: peptide/nickel transport system substrate-binding protein [Chloroflexota bacterium]|nr:peptide/nickel transport system substrate-binding protein [Chloroflexota bacterium]
MIAFREWNSVARRRATRTLTLLCGAGLLLTSCAPASTSNSQAPTGTNGQSAGSAPASRGTKTINMGMQLQEEPVGRGSSTGIINITGPGTTGNSGGTEHRLMFHAGLTIFDDHNVLQPHIAQQVPNLNDGSWKVNDDGTMELTWKLKPNVFWHDGTPLTASDFVFGTTVARDGEFVANPPAVGTRQLSDVLAPDPQTLLVHFATPFVGANLGDNTPALPGHILKETYDRGDKNGLQNSTYWTTDFVGLGPYKVGHWVLGSFLEGMAFDQYFLGRPKIDRVILRYYGDANTMVASLLAGDLDILPAGAQLDTRPLSTIRQSWGTSGGTVLPIPKGTRNFIPQQRDQTQPWVRDPGVRQAIALILDKQLIVDTLQDGATTPAYTSITPAIPAFQRLEQLSPRKWQYDPVQAARLLTDAGWTKGTDGAYRNAAGQQLGFDVTSSGQPKNVQEIEAIAAQYSVFGMQVAPTPYPASASNASEIRMTFKGFLVWPASSFTSALEGFSSSSIGTEQNRYRGSNYGGYSNPEYDRLYGEYAVTLDPQKSQDLVAQMMKVVADDVGAIPLYYVALGVAFRTGLVGPGGAAPDQPANAWNINTWDLQ